MKSREFRSKEFILTKKGVKTLALEIASSVKGGGIVCLSGEIGTGKTFFASNLIQVLTKNENLNITSPTFNIVNVYDVEGEKSIYHFDLYRIKNKNELENIGFFDAIEDNICIIEWPEIALPLLQNSVFISIMSLNSNKRKFILTYGD